MKKQCFLLLLLFEASMAAIAENAIYTSYQQAADAAHIKLKDKVEENGKNTKTIKEIRKSQNIGKDLTISYKIVSTKLDKNYEGTLKKNQQKKDAQPFVYVGNMTIKDNKNNKILKYVAKGVFIVKKDGKKGKQKTMSYKSESTDFKPEEIEQVSYFDNEARAKAKKMVAAYYKEHNEYKDVNIKEIIPYEDGYKITTTRTFYKDEQKYTGNKGTVVFFVEKGEELRDFKLLTKKEEQLTNFDNSPAPVVESINPPTIDNTIIEETPTIDIETIEETIISGFPLNGYILSEENMQQLDQVAEVLSANPEMEIQLLGHSCDIGGPEVNYMYGLFRAKRVKKYLISKGVENKIYVHSYGARKPLLPNSEEENRAQNRRVEIQRIK